MFPKPFSKESTQNSGIKGHQAVYFASAWPNEKITREIQKRGIAAFISPDGESTWGAKYNDGRLTGQPIVQTLAGCCSFSKSPTHYYLYPIHEAELAGVGITEDDLIKHIKLLNDLRVGFNYKYFGRHTAPSAADLWTTGKPGQYSRYVPASRYPTNEYFWVGVPKQVTYDKTTKKETPLSAQWSYLHWIYLRYLINSQIAGTSNGLSYSIYYGRYFEIPRVLHHLVDTLGLTPWKAFMYSCAAGAWYSGWGLAYTDYPSKYGGQDYSDKYIPDLSISRDTFKKIMANAVPGGYLNAALTGQQNSQKWAQEAGITLKGRHKPEEAIPLASAEKWVEFVDYMDRAYSAKRSSIPREIRKQLTATSQLTLKLKEGGKKIRKAVRKTSTADK